MSEKVCDHHKSKWQRYGRQILSGLLISGFVILIIFLIVWAILQPRKPSFTLQDATIFDLNVSAPNIISTTMQITVCSANPNTRIGIYYDKMDVYAAYHSQQITYFTAIPPTYQGGKDVDVWSPFVYGVSVPVAPYNGESLSQDKADGAVNMVIEMNGRIRWKVGTFVSGPYHVHVSCPAYIPLGRSNNNGVAIGNNAVKYELQQSCSVSV